MYLPTVALRRLFDLLYCFAGPWSVVVVGLESVRVLPSDLFPQILPVEQPAIAQ